MSRPSAEHDAAHAFGLDALREDPQYRRIAPPRRAHLVQAALEDGRALARRIARRYGSQPESIAGACQVAVLRSEADAGFGAVVVFADYTAQPPCVTLYLPAIRRLDAALREHRAGEAHSSSTLDMFLAHELYHHFDLARGAARLSRQHAVRLFSLGAWHWDSGIAALAEIAADAFAQQLLGLPVAPAMLARVLSRESAA